MPVTTVQNPSQVCICQICTCGRHRCPHRPGTPLKLGNNGNGTKLSEYNERYKENEGGVRREPLRRAKDQLGLPSDRFEDATTSRSDYVPMQSNRTQLLRNNDNLRPEGDLDLRTVYKDEYNHKPVVQRNQALGPSRRDNLGNSDAKFDAQPSYRDHYPEWPVERSERVRRSDRSLFDDGPLEGGTTNRSDFDDKHAVRPVFNRPKTSTKLEGEFYGNSTLRGDYQGLPGERARILKPQTAPLMSGDFDGVTTQRDYRRWDVSRPQGRKPQEYVRPEGVMDMNTTTSMDFRNGAGEKAKSLRPETATKISGDMDAYTTHRETFKGAKGEKAISYRPTANTVPNGHFEGDTTSRSDYTEKLGSRAKMQRPQTATKLSGDQEKETTNNAHFPPWKTQKPEFRHPKENVMSEGVMDMNTTMKTDFGNPKGDRAKALRPPTSQRYSGTFDGSTTHKQDYPGWKADRPQATNRSEYRPPTEKFDGQTTNRSDYVDVKGSERQRPAKRTETGLFDRTPLEGTTSYLSEYIHHGREPCPAEGLHGQGLGNEKFRYKMELGGHHFFSPAIPLR